VYEKPISSELANLLHDAESRDYDGRPPKISRSHLLEFISQCESPIEKFMLIAMAHMPCNVKPVLHDMNSGEAFPEWPVVIIPQVVIARYRVDFLVSVMRPFGSVITFAVECDGADYHYSIETRARDAERDRYLRCLGIKTIRYGGQKIKKLGYKCADEIASIVNEELSRNA
jgi:very-short-patch-repair endonuclease